MEAEYTTGIKSMRRWADERHGELQDNLPLFRQPVCDALRQIRPVRPGSIPNSSMHQMYGWAAASVAYRRRMMVPASRLAKAVGKPGKVIYSRENGLLTMDYSRPLPSRE